MANIIRKIGKIDRIYLIFLIFTGITFSLISCGDKEEADTSTVVEEIPWDGDPNSIPELSRKPNPAASPLAKKGGTFRIYSSQYPKSLNGYLDNFTHTQEIFRSMFEPLMTRNPLTLEYQPHIAKSWSISSDKKKFTFIIDQNAKWSDGKPITAKDVLFTYETLMNTKNNTAMYRIALSRFEAPRAVGEFEVEFTQKTIHWDNFEEIAFGFVILPEHHFQGKDFNKENFEFPVVSGPYELQAAKKGRYVKLRRRAAYWKRAYPVYKNTDNFDILLFKVFNEEPLAFQAFKKGDIDFFPVYKAYTWVREAMGESFDKNYIIKQKVYNEKPMGFQGWAFNLRRKPFDDLKVRKAIAHLVDRQLMVDKLAFKEYELTDTYFSSVWEGNRLPNPPIDYDPAKAKSLLAEAGWKPNAKGILEKDGKEFSITILDRDRSSEKYFTIFIERAKDIGILAKIESTDLANWSDRMDKYDFDLTWAAWGGGLFPDPEGQWYSKYADENGQNNITGYKNAEVDKLIEEQRTEFDAKKRADIVRKIDKILTRDVPYVLLWNTKSTRLLYWNRFGQPKNPLAKYSGEQAAKNLWWIDSEKSEGLESAKKNKTALPAYEPKVNYSAN